MKGFWPVVFYYFSEKFPLSQKLGYFLAMFYNIDRSPLLVIASKFYANNYVEYLPTVSSAYKDTGYFW